MANFEIADKITRGNEGGWQNDPADRGNSRNGLGTYRGIASHFHPAWKGWPIVAAEIAKLGPQPKYDTKAYYAFARSLNSVLAANDALQAMVRSFYKVNFWDALRLDDFKSQELANKVYDSSVNQGTGAAAIMLQKVLGVTVDGGIGPVTLAAVNKQDGAELAEKFKHARIAKYKRLVEARPDQAKYLDVWLARC